MSVLTLRTADDEDQLVEQLKRKYNIPFATKALLFAAQRCLELEKEEEELRKVRARLNMDVSHYREAGLSILSGLKELKELTKK